MQDGLNKMVLMSEAKLLSRNKQLEFSEYNRLKQQGYTIVPVRKSLSVSNENPVSIFAKFKHRKK